MPVGSDRWLVKVDQRATLTVRGPRLRFRACGRPYGTRAGGLSGSAPGGKYLGDVPVVSSAASPKQLDRREHLP